MNFSCTCIPPSAGGKRRRQLHWRRESLWDSNLQPDKWKWKQEVKVKMKKVKVGQHSATWQISVWNNTFNIFTTSEKWKLSPWDSNLKHDNIFKIASESGSCTSMHSKERVESVCHSLPERNSQDAASKERTKWLLVLFLLTHIYQDTFYQLFLHTLQSPHWSRFPPKSDFKPSFHLQNSYLHNFNSHCWGRLIWSIPQSGEVDPAMDSFLQIGNKNENEREDKSENLEEVEVLVLLHKRWELPTVCWVFLIRAQHLIIIWIILFQESYFEHLAWKMFRKKHKPSCFWGRKQVTSG